LYIFVAACGNDVATPPPDSTPTWYRDVEPIVQVHCDGCHAAGGIGPVQFTADTVVDQATNMAAQTSSHRMPPWQPALDTGPKLHGARVLDDDQIATIGAWSAAGAPLGDPADHGELQPVSSFGLTDPPDYTFKIAAPYTPDRSLTDDV